MNCTEICSANVTDIIAIGVAMVVCRNVFLFNKDFSAIRAMLTFGKTAFGTGGSYRLVGYFIMSLCGSKLFIAHSTNLCILAVCLCTGSVSLGRYGSLRYKDFVTNRAMLTFGKTAFGTGGSYRLVNYLCMRLCSCKLCITHSTNLCILAVCLCTGSVSLGRYGSLRYKDFVTNRAMLTFGKTAFGTGGRCSTVNHLGVSESRYDFLLTFTAGAGAGPYTVFGTSGIL